MKPINLPKSIPDSQRFVAWAFPGLLVYGVVAFPEASLPASIAILTCLFIVVTGWQSFGIIAEAAYNDIILMVDLSLLSTYWLLIYFSRNLGDQPNVSDVPIYLISGTAFFLYATWNAAAWAGSDTRAFATVAHLSKFAWITFFVSLVFFGIGIAVVRSGPHTNKIYFYARIAALLIWISVLFWWQIGKFIAAARDTDSNGDR